MSEKWHVYKGGTHWIASGIDSDTHDLVAVPCHSWREAILYALRRNAGNRLRMLPGGSYPKRALVPSPDSPVEWVGPCSPPMSDDYARAGDIWSPQLRTGRWSA